MVKHVPSKKFSLLLPDKLRAQADDAAGRSHRSTTAEINHRLEQSFAAEQAKKVADHGQR
jgi:hypothetical protein